jgi:hypothetical protein
MEGIERLDPNYLVDADHRKLMVALERLGTEQKVQHVAQSRAAIKPRAPASSAGAKRPTSLPADQWAALKPVRFAIARACLVEAQKSGEMVVPPEQRAALIIEVAARWVDADAKPNAAIAWMSAATAINAYYDSKKEDDLLHFPGIFDAGAVCASICGDDVERALEMTALLREGIPPRSNAYEEIACFAAESGRFGDMQKVVGTQPNPAVQTAILIYTANRLAERNMRERMLTVLGEIYPVLAKSDDWLRQSLRVVELLKGADHEAAALKLLDWVFTVIATIQDAGWRDGAYADAGWAAAKIGDDAHTLAAVRKRSNRDRRAYDAGRWVHNLAVAGNLIGARRLAEEIDSPEMKALSHVWLAQVCGKRGDRAQYEIERAEATRLIPLIGDKDAQARAYEQLTRSMIEGGDLDGAEELAASIAVPKEKWEGLLAVTEARLNQPGASPKAFAIALEKARGVTDPASQAEWIKAITQARIKAAIAARDWVAARAAASTLPVKGGQAEMQQMIYAAAIEAHALGQARAILNESGGTPGAGFVKVVLSDGDLIAAKEMTDSISDTMERAEASREIAVECAVIGEWALVKECLGEIEKPAARCRALCDFAESLFDLARPGNQ